MSDTLDRQRFADRYFRVGDGLRIHFRDYRGDASRPPMLCLPGLTRNARDFEDFSGRYSPRFRVIALDFRGRGLSDRDPLPQRYTPLTYAGDVIALLEYLEVPSAIFVGTSLGGLVTMIVAGWSPQRIHAAIINDVGPELSEAGLDRIRGYVGRDVRFASWDEASAAIAETNRDTRPDYTPADWLRMARRICREEQGKIRFDYDMAIGEPFKRAAAPKVDLWPMFKALASKPLLVVRGERSDLLSAEAVERMRQAAPEARFVAVPGVGHPPDLSEPSAVEAIDGFLEVTGVEPSSQPAMATASRHKEGALLTETFAPRSRKVKILATLGPASSDPKMIRRLMLAGADAFRINMSHGDRRQKARLVEAIRALEREMQRPATIVFDLQGPKLRVGRFAGGHVVLEKGGQFTFDRKRDAGDGHRVELPHPELFEAVRPGANILVDDGKVRLKVLETGEGELLTEVLVGGKVSDNKGVNVPHVLVPIPALTKKDRGDLVFALEQRADWIALSFVQRPEDVAEARSLIGDRAALMAKIEKPAAIERLEDIIALADGVMVARGDLGVELLPEEVPPLQNRIVACARQFGKPVVVATQMLESMINSPTPTRAEVSDVATAIYDGADAVMLSAESAAGQYPGEAVQMMDRIAVSVEQDPIYNARIHFTETRLEPTTADALAGSARQIASTISAKAMVCYTSSGSTARRIARERPSVPLLAMSHSNTTARRLGLLWGVHAVHTRDVASFEEMVAKAKRMALRHRIAGGGDRLVIMAGVPFGTAGSTNVIHVVRLVGDELERHAAAKTSGA